MKCKILGHHMSTVAIDTSHGWQRANGADGKFVDQGQHTLLYRKCSRCNYRDMIYDDATADGRDFAEHRHSDVAISRTKWIQAGVITGYDDDKILFVDQKYAPLGDFDSLIRELRNNPKYKSQLKQHSMIEDALGQLEVAIKLSVNNTDK